MVTQSPEPSKRTPLSVVDPLAADMDGRFLEESFLSWLKNESPAVFYGFFGIGPCSFVRKARMKKVHAAFCLALWRLALERAHQGASGELVQNAAQALGLAGDEAFRTAYTQLKDALPASGHENFSPAASALCEMAQVAENPILSRALALYSRRIYNNLLKYI